jgi:hypothetical protein
VWVTDPDGNEWEVFVVKADTETMNDDATKEGCCVPEAGAEPRAKADGACCG